MLPCIRTRRTVPRSPGCRRDTGNVYVVFELSESADPPRANRETFVKRSPDGGETFDNRVRLNDDQEPGRGGHAKGPSGEGRTMASPTS